MNTIHEIMTFSIPYEMREMTQEEYQTFFKTSNNEEYYGLYNENKHTMMAITYKKRPFLLGKDASNDEILKATEKKIKNQIPTLETYESAQKTVDHVSYPSFSFRYTVQGINQFGEYVLCRFSKYDISLNYICREEFADYGKQKFNEFLLSIQFKK